MQLKFCQNCGAQLADNVKFCANCGAVAADPPPAPSAPPPAPSAPPPAPSAPPPAPSAPPPAQSAAPTGYGAQYGNNYQTPPYQPSYNPQQYNNYQRPAAPPNNYQAAQSDLAAPMKVGDYILTIIIMGIPVVGFIMMLVWSFGSGTNINKKNYARAMLILGIIGVVLMIIFGSLIAGILTSILEGMGSYGAY